MWMSSKARDHKPVKMKAKMENGSRGKWKVCTGHTGDDKMIVVFTLVLMIGCLMYGYDMQKCVLRND